MGDVATVLTTARWSEDTYYLKEFVHKFKLPQVAKVVKGQYLNVGVSTISSPALCSTLLLGHTPRRPCLIAQCVKFKDGKRVVAVGPKLSIPETYDGYFEILSEEGRSVRCIESVSELARRFPESVLVRDNIKAFVSKSDDIETLHEKSRTILTGEILILVGEVLGVKGKNQTRYLRCFDAEGENVYLPYELKGARFSALAKEENISGVHTIANLAKKRLPLMVRLAHGSPPLANGGAGASSNKSAGGQQFVPELRLLARSDEELLMGVPLCKESQPVYLPLGVSLKLQPLVNFEYVSGMGEVSRLLEKGDMQLATIRDRILTYESGGREPERKNLANRKGSLPQDAKRNPPTTIYGLLAAASRSDSGGRSDDYDEIDQIYDYVRGFAPLPKTAKGWHYTSDGDEDHHRRRSAGAVLVLEVGGGKEGSKGGGGGGHYGRIYSAKSENSENRPPEPPPIETIPSRRGGGAVLLNNSSGGNKFKSGGGGGGDGSPNNSPMALTPPVTPPFSPPWGSPVHGVAPLGPSGQLAGVISGSPSHLFYERPQSADLRLFEKTATAAGDLQSFLSKKRQRPKTAEVKKAESEDLGKTTTPALSASPAPRYIKASHRQGSAGGGGSGSKHRFFKSRTKDKDGPPPPAMVGPPPPLGSCGQHNNNNSSLLLLGRTTSQQQQQQPSFFNLRYKSLTNLTQQQEYDTLDSSNSGGGKTSFDSAGSRNVPEKRSRRRLSRPKSLTNLVWDFRTGGGGGSGGGGGGAIEEAAPPLHRSNSKPSLLIPDRGRMDVLYGRKSGHDLSHGTKKMAAKNLAATLYL